ncbi:PREDICTED: uncharacterized protein LOC104793166 isoform X2 [Camelina sativa]|nr:PREDICTED: uncharacterized protein LOC104793166 isoform X2 [Camelina sativa]XP_019082334.1 PREDICTED: uncharacterized protein LOC104793166 isoform X2 [Camelina sativa]
MVCGTHGTSSSASALGGRKVTSTIGFQVSKLICSRRIQRSLRVSGNEAIRAGWEEIMELAKAQEYQCLSAFFVQRLEIPFYMDEIRKKIGVHPQHDNPLSRTEETEEGETKRQFL